MYGIMAGIKFYRCAAKKNANSTIWAGEIAAGLRY